MTRAHHNRLPRWHRRTLYAFVAVIAATGLAWLAVAYGLAAPDEPTPAPHRWAAPLLMWHGIASYAGVCVIALVGQAHLRTGWRIAALRPLGITLCISLALLVATGLAFYYSANESLLPWLRWSHVAFGALLPLVLLWHIVLGRRRR